MLGPRIVEFEAVIMLSCCLLSLLLFFHCFIFSHCVRVLCPRIVVFEAVILLACC